MKDDGYYHIERLLTMKDINGKTPDIYMVDGNRTAGKSYSIKTRQVRDFLNPKNNHENMFIYLYRYKDEMSNCAETYFGDICEQFPEYEMTEQTLVKGNVIQLSLNDIPCGYCLAINSSSKYKKMRGLFVNVKSIFFDEYQDEDNRYVPREIEKLMSILTTVSSGHGQQHRRVALIMASNTVSLLNPYYSALGISKRLQYNTKILRGDGWVLERVRNENASSAYKQSGVARAFSQTAYNGFATENKYLNDNNCLISKPTGLSKYIVTIQYNGKYYSARQYNDCIYISHGCDSTYPARVCFRKDDVKDSQAYLLSGGNYLVNTLRNYFNHGLLWFEDIECKNMIFDCLTF